MPDVTDLRQLVLRQLAVLGSDGRSLSHREAAARSGGRVSHATIGNIASGRHSGNIDDSTVDGLALALDVKRSEILSAIHRSHVAAGKPFEAPERWQRLTHAQRKLVIALGDGILAAYEQGRDDEAARGTSRSPARVTLSAVTDRDIVEGQRAARKGTSRGRQIRKELDEQAEQPDSDPGGEE